MHDYDKRPENISFFEKEHPMALVAVGGGRGHAAGLFGKQRARANNRRQRE
jgi:hypothetical protein